MFAVGTTGGWGETWQVMAAGRCWLGCLSGAVLVVVSSLLLLIVRLTRDRETKKHD
jgi:hypothetical protein